MQIIGKISFPSSQFLIADQHLPNLTGLADSSICQTMQSQITRMTTCEDRLNFSLGAIEVLSARYGDNPTIFEIGPGWPPVTPSQLAGQLRNSFVVAIDHNIPHYVVRTPTTELRLFDQNNNLTGVMIRRECEAAANLSAEVKKNKEAIGLELRKKTEKLGLTEYSEAGYSISINPARKYETDNLAFVSGDMFNLKPANLRRKADIVRISNSLIPHYTPADAAKALRELIPHVNDRGQVLIGYTNNSTGWYEEEYLVYKKSDESFKLEGYLFSVYVGNTLKFGTGEGHCSPASIMNLPRRAEIRLSELLEQKNEIRYAFWRRSVQNYGRVPTGEERRDIETSSREIPPALADALNEQGVPAEALGKMVFVKYEAPKEGNKFQSQFMDRIRTRFAGFPLEVDADGSITLKPKVSKIYIIDESSTEKAEEARFQIEVQKLACYRVLVKEHLTKAQGYESKHDYRSAIRECETALKFSPGDPKTQDYLAELCKKNEQPTMVKRIMAMLPRGLSSQWPFRK